MQELQPPRLIQDLGIKNFGTYKKRIGLYECQMCKNIFEAISNNVKKALKWFIIGYLSFILPLTLVYIFIPITRVAIASIMCGFAIIFAAILTFKIVPLYYKNK